MDRIEQIILRNLISNNDFSKKVLPYIKEGYFLEKSEQTIAKAITDYILKYKNNPTIEALRIDISNLPIREDLIQDIGEILNEFEAKKDKEIDPEWLLNQTEKFCKDKALHGAILESIAILDEKSKKDKGSLPSILQEALAVSFDSHVGHDYLDAYEDRFEFYHRKENKIPFDISILNDVTNGGVTLKTLNVLMAGVHVGKSLSLCHLAASYLSQGYNVLYITLEMAEEAIAQRIDANLLNVEMDDIIQLPQDAYYKKFSNVKNKTLGKLIIKEYPTASASVIHFNHLMNELLLKKNFKPQIVIVDYLNICASSRLKKGVGLYEYVKSISEELRGFAIENNVVLWSATQLNRAGFKDSDPGMEHSAESFGLPATCDLLWIMVTSDELDELGQILFKQEKNRYKDKGKTPRFVVGIDRPHMRLHDVEQSAQENIAVENEMKDIVKNNTKKMNEKFRGFKIDD